MSKHTAHAITATAVPTTGSPFALRAISSKVTLDEGWTPYAQAQLTIARPAFADYVRLDPRTSPRVTVVLEQNIAPTSSRTFDLIVRKREPGKNRGELTLTLAGNESLLRDYGLVSEMPLDVGLLAGTTSRGLAGFVLERMGFAFPDGLHRFDLFARNLLMNPGAEYIGVDNPTVVFGLDTLPSTTFTNLMQNPSPTVATGISGWYTASSSTTVLRSSTATEYGVSSCRSTCVTAGTVSISLGTDRGAALPRIDVTEGVTYHFGVSVRAGSVNRITRSRVIWYDALGATLTTDIGPNVSSSTTVWRRHQVLFSAPIGAKSAVFVIDVLSSTVGEFHYFDSALIMEASTATEFPFFSGSYNPVPGNAQVRWESPDRFATGTPPAKSFLEFYGPTNWRAVYDTPGAIAALAAAYTTPQSGTKSARLVYLGTGAAGSQGYPGVLAKLPGSASDAAPIISPGEVYTISAYVRSYTARTVRLRVVFFSASGFTTTVDGATSAALASGVWTRISIPTVTVPADRYWAHVVVMETTGTFNVGETLDVDGVMMHDHLSGSTLLPAFNGDSADGGGFTYDYRSEPSASVSVRNVTGYGLADPGAGLWNPGQAAWEFLAPLIQQTGFRLFADEVGVWRLADNTYSVPGTVALDDEVNLIDSGEIISRDEDDLWFDAVVIEYRWTDADGLSRTAWDSASAPGYSKVARFSYDTPYPGPGAASAILARALERGRRITGELVSDYGVQPYKAVTIAREDTPDQVGTISSVSWSTPDSTMVIDTKSLEDA